MNVPDRQSLWRLVGADAVASISFHATGVGSTTHDGELCGFVWLCTAHCQDIGHSVFCRLVQSSNPNQFVLWKCNTRSSCSKQGHTGTASFHAGHSASCPHPVTCIKMWLCGKNSVHRVEFPNSVTSPVVTSLDVCSVCSAAPCLSLSKFCVACLHRQIRGEMLPKFSAAIKHCDGPHKCLPSSCGNSVTCTSDGQRTTAPQGFCYTSLTPKVGMLSSSNLVSEKKGHAIGHCNHPWIQRNRLHQWSPQAQLRSLPPSPLKFVLVASPLLLLVLPFVLFVYILIQGGKCCKNFQQVRH